MYKVEAITNNLTACQLFGQDILLNPWQLNSV